MSVYCAQYLDNLYLSLSLSVYIYIYIMVCTNTCVLHNFSKESIAGASSVSVLSICVLTSRVVIHITIGTLTHYGNCLLVPLSYDNLS